jgi:hypothetical protein
LNWRWRNDRSRGIAVVGSAKVNGSKGSDAGHRRLAKSDATRASFSLTLAGPRYGHYPPRTSAPVRSTPIKADALSTEYEVLATGAKFLLRVAVP